MNAGEINIKVTASMDEFNRTMASVKSSADRAGDIAGKGFSNQFKSQIADISDNFSNQMLGNIRKAFGAGAFINGLSAALQSAASGADIATVFTDSVKALPFIGGLASAIEQAMASAMGTLEAEEGLASAMRKEAERARGREESARKIAISDQRIADRAFAVKESQMRREIQMSLEAGDKRAAADKEAQLEQMRLQERINQMMRDENYSWERESIQKLYLEEQKTIKDNLDRKYREIAAAEKKAQDDAAKLESDRATKLAEQKRKEAEALARDLADQEAALLDERMAAQASGLGTASTALGSFRFDAYPATQKKENDLRIVRALETIRDKQQAIGFT